MKKNKRAFTLIELIVVVGIIGLLASVILVFLSDARQKGKDTEKINSFAEVRKALQFYASDNNGFPGVKETLISKGYITNINPSILYTGRNMDGSVCASDSCPSYHIAVPLDNIGNQVLSSDSNGVTAGLIDGTKNNCLPSGTIGHPSLCYDIIP